MDFRIMNLKLVIYAIVFAIAFSFALYCNDEIQGGFKERTSYEYDYKLGTIDTSTKRKHAISKYNDYGKKVEHIVFSPDGKILVYDTYLYDKGNLIEIATFDEHGSLYNKQTNKFDEKENLIEYCNFNSNGRTIKHTYKYNSYGDMTKNVFYNSDGSILCELTFTYIYNFKGYKIEREGFTENGSQYDKNTYKYDDKGNLIELLNFDSKYSFDGKTTWKYDEDGYIIKKVIYNKAEVITSKNTNKYDYQEKFN